MAQGGFSTDRDIQKVLHTINVAPFSAPDFKSALAKAAGMPADARTYVARKLQEKLAKDFQDTAMTRMNEIGAEAVMEIAAFICDVRKKEASFAAAFFMEQVEKSSAKTALFSTAAMIQNFNTRFDFFIEDFISARPTAEELTKLIGRFSKWPILERLYIADAAEIALYSGRDGAIDSAKKLDESKRGLDAIRLRFIIETKGEATPELIKKLAAHEERHKNDAARESYIEDLASIYAAVDGRKDETESTAETTQEKLKALRKPTITLKKPTP